MASLPRPSPAHITHIRSRPPHRLSFDQTPSHQRTSKSPQANGLLSPGMKGQGFRLSTDFNLNSPQKTQPQSPIFRDDRSTRGLLRPSEPNSSSSTPTNSAWVVRRTAFIPREIARRPTIQCLLTWQEAMDGVHCLSRRVLLASLFQHILSCFRCDLQGSRGQLLSG